MYVYVGDVCVMYVCLWNHDASVNVSAECILQLLWGRQMLSHGFGAKRRTQTWSPFCGTRHLWKVKYAPVGWGQSSHGPTAASVDDKVILLYILRMIMQPSPGRDAQQVCTI
jgi:hypothetical protein